MTGRLKVLALAMALNHGQAGPATSLEAAGAPGARRLRRRQETIDEILQHAVAVMQADGVAALSLSEVARRMGIKPPSLYKYFPSKLAVYDELFRRLPDLEPANDEPLPYRASNFIDGPEAMPETFTPTAPVAAKM